MIINQLFANLTWKREGCVVTGVIVKFWKCFSILLLNRAKSKNENAAIPFYSCNGCIHVLRLVVVDYISHLEISLRDTCVSWHRCCHIYFHSHSIQRVKEVALRCWCLLHLKLLIAFTEVKQYFIQQKNWRSYE